MDASYPQPLIIPPSARHTHTFILLHGCGSNAEEFGVQFITSRTSSGKMLPQLFPGMKFIFPTAKRRRATAHNRAIINQWFDIYSLNNPSERQELQVEGLRESGAFISQFILEEAKAVTLENVIIGGLSQGCAMGLHVLLSLETDVVEDGALGGFVGMSGWLPFRIDLEGIVEPSCENPSDDDPFERNDGDSRENDQSVGVRVMNLVRDNTDLPPLTTDLPSCLQTPIFLGHGEADDKVSVKLGQEAASTLIKMGMDIAWKGYKDFGHWYKLPDELDDIVDFLHFKVGIDRLGKLI